MDLLMPNNSPTYFILSLASILLRINKSWHEFSEEFNLQHETVWYKNMAIWVWSIA